MHLTVILAGVALALLLGAGVHDFATRTVPNWAPAGVAGAGLALRLLTGDLIYGLGFAFLVFAAAVAIWRAGLMGGADAKLLGAAALAAPPVGIPNLLLLTALSGGVLAVCYLVLSYVVSRPPPGRRRTMIGRIAKAERWRLSRRGPLPYAAAIAAGGVVALSPQIWG
jgi:prepilin peptidase CpaA